MSRVVPSACRDSSPQPIRHEHPMSTTEPDLVGVLLVDDQELVRSGLRRILRRKDGFAIVGECADGSEVATAVEQHRPDVVVMDLRMRDVDGIEATRRLWGNP